MIGQIGFQPTLNALGQNLLKAPKTTYAGSSQNKSCERDMDVNGEEGF
jgi:hypothetical protein